MRGADAAWASSIQPRTNAKELRAGSAPSRGSRQAGDELTARFAADGYPVVEGPRETGDRYYESVVLDPDGNRLEITA